MPLGTNILSSSLFRRLPGRSVVFHDAPPARLGKRKLAFARKLHESGWISDGTTNNLRYVAVHNYAVMFRDHDHCYKGCPLPDDALITMDKSMYFIMKVNEFIQECIDIDSNYVAKILRQNHAVLMRGGLKNVLLDRIDLNDNFRISPYENYIDYIKADPNLHVELGDRAVNALLNTPINDFIKLMKSDIESGIVVQYNGDIYPSVYSAPSTEIEEASGFISWDPPLTDADTIVVVGRQVAFVSLEERDVMLVAAWLLESCDDPKDIPDDIAVGEIVGMRWWYPGDSSNAFWFSTNRSGVGLYGEFGRKWDDPEQTAKCYARFTKRKSKKHDAPDPSCTCGIYLKLKDDGASLVGQWWWGEPDTIVLGLAKASGRCMIGSTGLRAQTVRTTLLVIPSEEYRRHVWSGVKVITREEALSFMSNRIAARNVAGA